MVSPAQRRTRTTASATRCEDHSTSRMPTAFLRHPPLLAPSGCAEPFAAWFSRSLCGVMHMWARMSPASDCCICDFERCIARTGIGYFRLDANITTWITTSVQDCLVIGYHHVCLAPQLHGPLSQKAIGDARSSPGSTTLEAQ